MTVAAIYVRKTERGVSMDEQLATCVKAIGARGWERGETYLDEEQPSGDPGKDYVRCLLDMRRRRMGVVVAYSAERMFRDLAGVANVMRSARGNVGLYLCQEGISTAGLHGAFLMQSIDLVTRVMMARQSEVISRALRRRKSAGLRVGRPPRFTPELDAHIEELLEGGVPQAKIERDLGVTQFKVRQVYRAFRERREACTP